MLPSLPYVRCTACRKASTFKHGGIRKEQQHLWLIIQPKPYPYERLLRFEKTEPSAEKRKESEMG
jgi:hypothetical protein